MVTPVQIIITGASAVFSRASYLLVFFAGIIVGSFGVILLGRIMSWIDSKKRARYGQFKLGKNLFEVDVPDFLPHDEEETEKQNH